MTPTVVKSLAVLGEGIRQFSENPSKENYLALDRVFYIVFAQWQYYSDQRKIEGE